MTTEETLTFFAALMLPAHMGGADKAARVKEVLAALGLSHTAHTLVGDATPVCLPLWLPSDDTHAVAAVCNWVGHNSGQPMHVARSTFHS